MNCSCCAYYGDLTDISDDTKRALVDISYSHQNNEERKATNEPRLFVRDADKRLKEHIDQSGQSCPLCESFLVLPDCFLSMVGSYLDDIALEQSRKFAERIKARQRENKPIDKNFMYPFGFD